MPLLIATVSLSALLLFLVQPMASKWILPALGGSPAVWNTCMIVFQMLLLFAYAYVHIGVARLGVRKHAIVHGLVMLAALLFMPLVFGELPGDAVHAPQRQVVELLLATIALPFFVLACTAPLTQYWLASSSHPAADHPYPLYSASNAASLLALLSYPLLVEPLLSLDRQAVWWSYAFMVFGLLMACSFLRLRPTDAAMAVGSEAEKPPGREEKLAWVLLAFFPSSLMLGVTTLITTDIASLPLFWVLPLSIYLLTFILAFARRPLMVERAYNAQIVLVPFTLFVMIMGVDKVENIWILHLFTLFALCMSCHGSLVALKPSPRYLTSFYLWVALGGMLGGMFNALAAPRLFSGAVEYPLALLASLFVCRLPVMKNISEYKPLRDLAFIGLVFAAMMGVIYGFRFFFDLTQVKAGWEVFWQWLGASKVPPTHAPVFAVLFLLVTVIGWKHFANPMRFAGVIAAAYLALNLLSADITGTSTLRLVHEERNFFGILRVIEDEDRKLRKFTHGTTVHGIQSTVPERQREIASYYHGIHAIVRALKVPRDGMRLAFLGMGAGTLACLIPPNGQAIFYEIDPAVERIATQQEYFTFISNCAPDMRTVLGDGRLKLAEEPDASFDVIVMDAFTSDAIPMHLLTREAISMYRAKLKPGGLLLFNVSNRHLDLRPQLAAQAAAQGMTAYVGKFAAETDLQTLAVWVAIAESDKAFASVARHVKQFEKMEAADDVTLWTDQYSNILSAILENY